MKKKRIRKGKAGKKTLKRKRLRLVKRRTLKWWPYNRKKRRGKWKARRRRGKAARSAMRRGDSPVEQPVMQPASIAAAVPPPATDKGVNLIGFIRAEMGVGQSCRLAAGALEAAQVPFGIINYPETGHQTNDLTWQSKETNDPKYRVNLYHINAAELGMAKRYFGDEMFSGRNRYRIGYWHWELPEFPDEFIDRFALVDEVWVPTRFVYDSISRKATVPVILMPHGVEIRPSPNGARRDSFGLPEDRYLFLSMYDTMSYQERKNPQAVVEAFKLAFDRDDPAVGLVLKVNNAHSNHADWEVLSRLIDGHSNIFLIGDTLPRSAINALLQCTDCFVSLHRSEGFGLGLAEAMYLGKPVIGTGWSGNADFMNAANSCPVNYRLVQVGSDWGPYRAHQFWAEPDIHHAAEQMRRLAHDPEFRHTIAEAGKRTIHHDYSPLAAGERMKRRLAALGLL